MTATTHPTSAPAAPAPAAPARIPTWSRVYGLGSVFAKTLRDSRLAVLVITGLTAGLLFVVSSAIGQVFPSPEARAEVARLATQMEGVAGGISGRPLNVDTLGGYVQWKYGPVFAIIAALWSMLALSGTLAGEARRGSLELVAVAPLGRRRLAVEKVAAHLMGTAIVVVAMALAAWVASSAFGTLPVDAIALSAAVAYALWVGLIALSFGSLAFALSQLVGRAAGAGISGALLFAGWVLSNFQATVSGFPPVASLTPWGWTLDHLPLAGQVEWASLVLPAVVVVVLLAAGIEAFARRDLGAVTALPTPGMPTATLGLREPIGRSLGERLPVALAWAVGIGAFGFMLAAISVVAADMIGSSPDMRDLLDRIFPLFDIGTAGGFLQLMVQILYIVAGFAAATLVSGWASDETSGRLEMLLTSGVSRSRWAIRSRVGVLLAIGVMTVVIAVAIGTGAAVAGSDALTPMVGTLVLGLYATALAGIGLAVGGFRASVAAEVVALVVIVTYLIDLLAPAFGLPDWVHQLALTSHLGQPMVGIWDWAGMALCAVLAVGGLAIGAWALGRRDVAR
jgi:ABC-2 type transport system permease protein